MRTVAVLVLLLARAGDGDVPTPDRAFLRSMIASREAMGRHLDRTRGLLLILHHGNPTGRDPRADARGVVRVAERLCGQRLDTEVRALRRTLALRLGLPTDGGGITCRAQVCQFGPAPAPPGMARAGALVFSRDPGRQWRLHAVIMREPGSEPSGEAAIDAWIAERLRALSDGSCAADAR